MVNLKHLPKSPKPTRNDFRELKATRQQETTLVAIRVFRWASFGLLIYVLLGAPAMAGLPAFPGAEGGGALAVGGRGGFICEVTHLDDSGPGSLRACIDMKGPRTVIFRVGGTIFLKDRINISNPYLTIAGQTAPGDGIQIAGRDVQQNLDRNLITISADQVVIRYVRIRVGRRDPAGTSANPVQIWGASNVVLDHVSLMWAEGTNLSIWHGARNISVQNSIMAEPLNTDSTTRVNVITGASDSARAEQMVDIDFHRNLFANASHRNPLLKNARTRVINNIIYNWRLSAAQIGPGNNVDVIGNLFEAGPIGKSSRDVSEVTVYLWSSEMSSADRYPPGDPSVYVSGNIGSYHGADNHSMVWQVTESNGRPIGLLPDVYRRDEALKPTGRSISIVPAEELKAVVLGAVGSSHRLGCDGEWIFVRDAADARLIEGFKKNEGELLFSEDEVGGFPVIATGVACQDTSGDGIPDVWAEKNGFRLEERIGNLPSENGYTYLELYLNGPIENATPVATPAPPASLSVH